MRLTERADPGLESCDNRPARFTATDDFLGGKYHRIVLHGLNGNDARSEHQNQRHLLCENQLVLTVRLRVARGGGPARYPTLLTDPHSRPGGDLIGRQASPPPAIPPTSVFSEFRRRPRQPSRTSCDVLSTRQLMNPTTRQLSMSMHATDETCVGTRRRAIFVKVRPSVSSV